MNVCVFCGSRTGDGNAYRNAALELAAGLIAADCSLVYGGGNIGLMGILADEMLAHGKIVTGVIPDFLVRQEVAHQGITHLEVVETMHARKLRMAELADCFIALPGGWGTLDELAEILTWKQLGLTDQPIGLLNAESFFHGLLGQMEHMVREGFLEEFQFRSLVVAPTAPLLLRALGILADKS